MIERISDYPDDDTKKELIRMIANQMKKCFLSWNKEVVDDRKIFDDLRELSKGKIDVAEDIFKLMETKDVLHSKKVQNKPKKK